MTSSASIFDLRLPRFAAMRVILFSLLSAVIVQTPSVKLVRLETIRDLCRPDGAADACTRFVSYRLEASCVARGDGRAIEAAVTFRPIILLANLHELSHEQEHIEDMRRFAAAYVTEIEQKTFESDARCRAEALVATARFGETMREFAARSNRLRR